MTPDDERPRTPAGDPAPDALGGPDTGDEQAGDDLESLAGALPAESASESAHADADETLDLGALAAVGGQRASRQAAEDDARLSLGATPHAVASGAEPAAQAPSTTGTPASSTLAARVPGSAAAASPEAASASGPSPGPRARGWVMPLLIGLGVGAGAAAVVFWATSGSEQAASAASPQVAAPRLVPLAAGPTASAAAAPAAAPALEAAPAHEAAPATTAPPQAPDSPFAPYAQDAPAATPPPAAAQTVRKSAAAAPSSGAPQESTASAPPGTATAPVLDDDDPLADGETPAGDKAPASADASAKSTSSMDALLDQALSPTARRDELARRQQLALAQEELPLTPSRDDVTQAMTVLLPAIRGCAMGQSGLATAGIVVRGDGRVAGVEIAGAPFAGTASGRCMEGVIRRARFSRFRQPILRIKFPLAIQ